MTDRIDEKKNSYKKCCIDKLVIIVQLNLIFFYKITINSYNYHFMNGN